MAKRAYEPKPGGMGAVLDASTATLDQKVKALGARLRAEEAARIGFDPTVRVRWVEPRNGTP